MYPDLYSFFGTSTISDNCVLNIGNSLALCMALKKKVVRKVNLIPNFTDSGENKFGGGNNVYFTAKLSYFV